MTDNQLRDRIAAVIAQTAEGRAVYQLTNADAAVMADAVMHIVNLHIPAILASAIHAYADEELVALRFHGGGTAVEQVEDLHRNAAQIVQHAITHAKWDGPTSREGWGCGEPKCKACY